MEEKVKNKKYVVGDVINNIEILAILTDEKIHRGIAHLCKCFCGEEFKTNLPILLSQSNISCGCRDVELGDIYWKFTIVGKTEGKSKTYDCKCECGEVLEVQLARLESGNKKSCHNCVTHGKFEIGDMHGELTIIKDLGARGDDRTYRYVLCKCSCGQEKEAQLSKLKCGVINNCDNDIHRKTEVLPGTKFKFLTIIKELPKDYSQTNPKRYFECKCNCGNICKREYSALNSGSARSCGCMRGDQKVININDKYGDLTVLTRQDVIVNDCVMYYCECDCGNFEDIRAKDLMNGSIVKCDDCYGLNMEIGTKTNMLTYISYAGKNDNGNKQGNFKCDCGNEIIRSEFSVKAGLSKSCGCVKNIRVVLDPWQAEYNAYISGNNSKRELEFNLTVEQFKELLTYNCFYCNTAPSIKMKSKRCSDLRGSIDRKDSSIGYIYANCLASCYDCNSCKSDISQDGFLLKVKNIYENLKLNENIDNIIFNNDISLVLPPNNDNKDPWISVYNKYVAKNETRRKIDFQLTKEQFEYFVKNNCFYCGCEPNRVANPRSVNFGHLLRNGIDRINNDIGYVFDNCISCCTTCNTAKSKRTIEEFLLKIKTIYEFIYMNNSV